MSAHGVTAFRGPNPSAVAGRVVTTAPSAASNVPPPRPRDRLLSPVGARVTSTLALTAFGALHWFLMVEPAAHGRALYAVALAALVAGALVAAGRLGGPRRAGALALTVATGAVLALLAGGVAAEQLRWSNWGALATSVAGGLGGLPGARVPYRGLDEDLGLVVELGGTLLAFAGALLACWPRRDGRLGFGLAALIALVTLYAVPAVSLVLDAEFLRGALLAMLVVAYLRLDRLRPQDAPAALGTAGAAAVLALVLAPALDHPDPWWNYEDWAESAAGARTTSFDWDHDYAALDWPRDGRELLRIRSRRRAYWRADTLDVFDGRQWVRDRAAARRDHSTILVAGVTPERFRRWSFRVQVTLRGLSTSTLPLAGSPSDVVSPDRETAQIRPGVWTLGRSARRGDAYQARAYVPEPSARELAHAGTTYRFELLPYTRVDVVPRSGRFAGWPLRTSSSSFFGSPPVLRSDGEVPAAGVLADSDLRRVHRLSRRLLQEASTPYEYVKAVQRYLVRGFEYSETPPRTSLTLDGFLFRSRVGYCQHFSGAMALLLRLGGVPARVATGFSPGSYDKKAREYVVRDVDAHSWVEAFFPGIGWVTFDPTPAAAPPRSQAFANAPTAASGDIRDAGTTQVVPLPVEDERDVPWGLVAMGAAGLLTAGLAGRALRARRGRGRCPAVMELERALRGAGEALPPGLTLQAIETRYHSSPPVAGYAAALRAERYAPGGGGPTPAQRRALRRALGRGRGPVARVRAWVALPPRLRVRRPFH